MNSKVRANGINGVPGSRFTNCGKRPLSVGVIGAGEIATNIHIPILRTIDDVSIQWLTDCDGFKAERTGRAFKIPYFTTPDDLTTLPSADIVLLTVPFGFREPFYRAFRNTASAVYVEKPFSKSTDHHKRICSYFPEYALACGFQRRSWGPNLWVKDLIDCALFGSLRSIEFELGYPSAAIGGRFAADLGASGGGMLFEVGVHGIDTALFASDAVDVAVQSRSVQYWEGFDVHTEASAAITRHDGQVVQLDITVSCIKETSNKLTFRFDNAILSYSLFGNGDIEARAINGRVRAIVTPRLPCQVMTAFQTFYSHWNTFIAGIRSQSVNITSATQCLLTTAAVEQIYAGEHVKIST